jgi:hypothetical protein
VIPKLVSTPVLSIRFNTDANTKFETTHCLIESLREENGYLPHEITQFTHRFTAPGVILFILLAMVKYAEGKGSVGQTL